MTEYSGRTTAYEHKFDNWKENGLNIGEDCIQHQTIFEVQWSNCPIEVQDEVRKLWRDYGFGNDYYYAKWDIDEDDNEGNDYPLIKDYLLSRGIKKCLIHWWW